MPNYTQRKVAGMNRAATEQGSRLYTKQENSIVNVITTGSGLRPVSDLSQERCQDFLPVVLLSKLTESELTESTRTLRY